MDIIENSLGKSYIKMSDDVFKAIFDRMRKGQQQEIDWFVLLGTIGRLDSDGKILLAILERYPCFDEATTKENIRRYKEDYYPATFGYV